MGLSRRRVHETPYQCVTPLRVIRATGDSAPFDRIYTHRAIDRYQDLRLSLSYSGAPTQMAEDVSSARLLVVEDDPTVSRLICRALEGVGHSVQLATSARAAYDSLQLADRFGFDAILLDLQLPDDNGLSLLEKMRALLPRVPVLIVTGQRAESDIIRGLDAGADDYVVKPFSMSVLLARVRAMLRRATLDSETTRIGELRFDRLNRVICTDSGVLNLTPKEYTLLEYFLLRPEEVISRSTLLEGVWGMSFDPGSNLVDVHIARLRRKLHEHAASPQLRTVRGVGFQLTTTAEQM